MKILDLNKAAWDQAVADGDNPYTQVVSPEQVAAARAGTWAFYLSDCKPVPAAWFPNLQGCRVLCLASGGGQQAPIFAALGAEVTSFDASPRQLERDQFVAEREGLNIRLIEGDMGDLSVFDDDSFDLIFNPPSTIFVPDLAPIWRECARVLRPSGRLMTGIMNPDEFIFDPNALDNEGEFVVKYPLPYIEYETLSPAELEARIQNKGMFHFSHTLDDQLGGLIEVGFVITGFYEDRRPTENGNPIYLYMPSYYNVLARNVQLDD
jgi:SAM-dependent methyltransferase